MRGYPASANAVDEISVKLRRSRMRLRDTLRNQKSADVRCKVLGIFVLRCRKLEQYTR